MEKSSTDSSLVPSQVTDEPVAEDVARQKVSPGSTLSDLLKVSPQEARQLIETRSSLMISQTHAGPLPPPEMLVEYGRIIPNGADRIMTLAEKQTEHRISIESRVIESQQNQSGRGQIFAFILALVGLGLATYLAMNGHDWVAGIFAGTTLVSLVSFFLVGKTQQRKSLQEKRPVKPSEVQEGDQE